MTRADEEQPAEVSAAVQVIRAAWPQIPRAAIVLGSGLGALTQQMTIDVEWPYSDLPRFVRSHAEGHRGRLLAGRLGSVPILAMDGRVHLYEGYSFQQVTFPIRVFAALGARVLIVSNASGGVKSDLRSGDLLLIEEHVNLMGAAGCPRSARPSEDLNQSIWANIARRRPFYDPELLALAEQAAADEGISLRRGTYIGVLGPNYETRAEYRWLCTLGDVVGMSTVPEVLVAREVGLPVVAFSVVANVFRPENVQPTTSDEVIRAAASAEPKLRRIVTQLLSAVALTSDL